MPQIALDQSVISYDDDGQGEPALLFLPSVFADRSIFHNVMPCWSRRRRTLALDWRGHGASGSAGVDAGMEGLLEDALAVIESSGAQQVVPVALASAGWVAIQLRRWLGQRVPRLVLLDWRMADHPAPSLADLQRPDTWQAAVQHTLHDWLRGADHPQVCRFVLGNCATFGFHTWARAARSISRAYNDLGSPFRMLARLSPAVPVLHLFAETNTPAYVHRQRTFAARHPWFRTGVVRARSHFPMLEAPEEIAGAIEQFINPGRRAYTASA